MKKETLMGIIALILLGACVFIYYNTTNSGITIFAIAENGVCEDISCMTESLFSCIPAKMLWETNNEENQVITLEILGSSEGLCAFKMYSDDTIFRECYFPVNLLSAGLAEQFFSGTDKGFGKAIADSCR